MLIEKPSVLELRQLDELVALARDKQVLAKVVYHKLSTPITRSCARSSHDGELQARQQRLLLAAGAEEDLGRQFAEWIAGRNPGTYVAVHYIKLIDFTFGGRLKTVACTGQRGIVGPGDGPTWDSTQLRLIYEYPDGREAAFDIHTSWVTPDNFPGYVEQEVQFRFDNGVWNGHSRKRGVEFTIEGRTPTVLKTTLNNHYNGTFLEPWGDRSQRGYGIEVLDGSSGRSPTSNSAALPERRHDRAGGNARASLQRSRGRSPGRGRRAGDGGDSGPRRRRARRTASCAFRLTGAMTLHLPGRSEPVMLYPN